MKTWPLLALTMFACRSDRPIDEGDRPASDAGVFVAPVTVDLGVRGWPVSEVDGWPFELEVENTGGSPVVLEGLALPDGSVFSFDTALPLELSPGEEQLLILRLRPTAAGPVADELTYTVDGEPGGTTTLLAEVQAGRIDAPAQIDFGEIEAGCSSLQELVLGNVGDGELELLGLSPTSVDVEVGGTGLPVALGPGDSADFTLEWTPTAAGELDAELLIEGDGGPEKQARVALVGTAVGLESFVVSTSFPHWSQADLLMHYDCSVSPTVGRKLESGTADLIGALADGGLSPRLSYVVEDSGCIRGSTLVLDPSFSDSEANAVAEEMLGIQRAYGHDCERAFLLLERALGEDSAGGCNEGLMREESTWHLVSLSNEDEQSGASYTTFVADFQSLAPSAEQLRMHAIGGDSPDGCSGDSIDAGPYTGFYEATVATGGAFFSYCDPLEDSLDGLAEAIVDSSSEAELAGRTVVLGATGEVDETTLVVTVDGVALSAAEWVYDVASDSVTLGASPAEGAVIEVSWTRLPDCPE